MGFLNLVIDRRAARLSYVNPGVLVVEFKDGEQHRVGIKSLDTLVVYHDVALSAALIRACSDNGVGIALLPGRGHGSGSFIFPPTSRGAQLRLAQYRLTTDTAARVALARDLVARKTAAQFTWLAAHGLAIDGALFQDQIAQAQSLERLRGLEGAAAARYFSLWQTLWEPPWSFARRERRPPRDPVNALLSLTYTLATFHCAAQATRRGLDLQLGALHEPWRDRDSLALDLIEPVRPAIDQWVWQFLNSGRLGPEHFSESKTEGCRLNQEGRRSFYPAWFDQAAEWLKRPMRETLRLVLSHLGDDDGLRENTELPDYAADADDEPTSNEVEPIASRASRRGHPNGSGQRGRIAQPSKKNRP